MTPRGSIWSSRGHFWVFQSLCPQLLGTFSAWEHLVAEATSTSHALGLKFHLFPFGSQTQNWHRPDCPWKSGGGRRGDVVCLQLDKNSWETPGGLGILLCGDDNPLGKKFMVWTPLTVTTRPCPSCFMCLYSLAHPCPFLVFSASWSKSVHSSSKGSQGRRRLWVIRPALLPVNPSPQPPCSAAGLAPWSQRPGCKLTYPGEGPDRWQAFGTGPDGSLARALPPKGNSCSSASLLGGRCECGSRLPELSISKKQKCLLYQNMAGRSDTLQFLSETWRPSGGNYWLQLKRIACWRLLCPTWRQALKQNTEGSTGSSRRASSSSAMGSAQLR